MKTFIYIAGFWSAVLLGAYIYAGGDVEQPPGILAPEEPQQTYIVPKLWDRGDAHFTAVATFELKARVLSINRYSFDAESAMSPVDLALGWGRMSDTDVLKHMAFRQSLRAYYWRQLVGQPLPLPRKEIISHSANMHMIPSDSEIEKTLLSVRTGEIVEILGYLVNVSQSNGRTWKTSLSRLDTGPNSCEVVWVEQISRTGRVSEVDGR